MMPASFKNKKFFAALRLLTIASIGIVVAILIPAGAASNDTDRISFSDNQTRIVKNATVNNGYVEFGSDTNTTTTTHDMSNMTTAPGSTPVNANYTSNLAKLLASPYRNRSEDSSPFLNTASAALPKSQLYGPRSSYSYFGPHSDPEGRFRVECEFSHFSYDDPIVYPGKPEQAHLHMYFGNTHANAFSNFDTIMNSGGGTCNGHELNRTAYWAPAMLDGKGNVLVPRRILVYYKSFNAAVGKTQVYPDNMQIVADSSINNRASDIASYQCENHYGGGDNQKQDTMPNCIGGTSADGGQMLLEMNIKFNQCWNGLDPSNYKANLTAPLYHWYSGTCPASHSKIFPNLEYRIFYDIKPGENTSQWYISSDVDRATGTVNPVRGSTVHADWFGGWNKEINKMWIDNCVNTRGVDCSDGYLGGSTPADTQFPALKRHTDYPTPAPISGSSLLKALCTSGKTYTKPTDVAYCR